MNKHNNLQKAKKNVTKNKNIDNIYKTMWFIDSVKEFKKNYESYYDNISLEIIYAFNLNNNPNSLFEGNQSKILINKKISNNNIFGLCAVNFYLDNYNNKILKIKHLSVVEKDEENINYYKEKMQFKIIKEFIDMLSTLDCNIIETNFILMKMKEIKYYLIFLMMN